MSKPVRNLFDRKLHVNQHTCVGMAKIMDPDLWKTRSGQQRAKCSLEASKREKISFVPGIYEAKMGMKIGSDGKPVLTVEDLDFFSRVQILPEQPEKK